MEENTGSGRRRARGIEEHADTLLAGIADGSVVPYLGPGVLGDVVHQESGGPIPAQSDDLILAMNGGRPMAPRLMWEFPRAAMAVELKRGRSALTRFLDETYGDPAWTRSALHEWLSARAPQYVIDVNRDAQLQQGFADRPHVLIRGVARVAGTDYRFRIHHFDGASYHELDPKIAQPPSPALPILFKPIGSPVPDSTYVASDADYVDYITELMGGFAIPGFLKKVRVGKRYLILGLRLVRDTERMILSDLVYDAGEPTGWALIPEPSEKERRFCGSKGIEIIEADWPDLLAATG